MFLTPYYTAIDLSFFLLARELSRIEVEEVWGQATSGSMVTPRRRSMKIIRTVPPTRARLCIPSRRLVSLTRRILHGQPRALVDGILKELSVKYDIEHQMTFPSPGRNRTAQLSKESDVSKKKKRGLRRKRHRMELYNYLAMVLLHYKSCREARDQNDNYFYFTYSTSDIPAHERTNNPSMSSKELLRPKGSELIRKFVTLHETDFSDDGCAVSEKEYSQKRGRIVINSDGEEEEEFNEDEETDGSEIDLEEEKTAAQIHEHQDDVSFFNSNAASQVNKMQKQFLFNSSSKSEVEEAQEMKINENHRFQRSYSNRSGMSPTLQRILGFDESWKSSENHSDTSSIEALNRLLEEEDMANYLAIVSEGCAKNEDQRFASSSEDQSNGQMQEASLLNDSYVLKNEDKYLQEHDIPNAHSRESKNAVEDDSLDALSSHDTSNINDEKESAMWPYEEEIVASSPPSHSRGIDIAHSRSPTKSYRIQPVEKELKELVTSELQHVIAGLYNRLKSFELDGGEECVDLMHKGGEHTTESFSFGPLHFDSTLQDDETQRQGQGEDQGHIRNEEKGEEEQEEHAKFERSFHSNTSAEVSIESTDSSVDEERKCTISFGDTGREQMKQQLLEQSKALDSIFRQKGIFSTLNITSKE